MRVYSYRFVFSVFLSLCGLIAPVQAQDMTEEQVRTRILDSCVYAEWSKRAESGGVVKICACTAEAVISTMSEQEIARYNPDRRMSRTLKTRYGEALASCV